MKVIFLDIDGVLNSDEYVFDRRKNEELDEVTSEIMVDGEAIKLLKEAIDATGSRVVLSSSWRYTLNSKFLKELLSRYEITTESTPYIDNRRGEEIKEYLKLHPEVEDYIILDDDIFDTYDEELLSHLILVSGNDKGRGFGKGLQRIDIDEIIKRFGRKKDKDQSDDFEL